jgi:outer membrane protein OmpA-like peptidoglycan-associated protein
VISNSFAKSTIALALVISVCASGCATAPPIRTSKTTVVLMPDEDGHVGAVNVSSDSGSQTINEAYNYTTVDGLHVLPTVMNAMGQDAVNDSYSQLIKAQPPKPKSFVLHFMLDKTTLTEESKAMLSEVMAAVQERKPTEISIFGHTDATGSESHNFKLSADRAKAIESLLKKNDPTLDHIDVQFFGDKVPAVPGDARTPEPRNRRAEVQIL